MPNRVRLLVIEDDPADAILLDAALDALVDPPSSFQLTVADSLERGLAALENAPFAAVLLDLHLPDAVGLEGLAAIRAAHPVVPIVVLTSAHDHPYGERAVRAGAQDYLVKGADDGRTLHNRVLFAIQRQALAIERDRAQRLLQERSEQLQTAYEELDAVHQLRERLISVVSHELRTPLTPILGFAETLGADPDLSERNRAAVTAILRNARRLHRRIDGLLHIGQSRNGGVPTRREPVKVHAMLNAALDDLHGTIGEVDVRVTADPWVIADAGHLRQILENLLLNAAKHGRPPLSVELGVDGEQAVLAIADSGDGIDPEFVATMWEPFTQASLVPVAGVGLGLAIVRLLAQANDIQVDYDASADGARFTLRVAAISVDHGNRLAAELVDTPPPARIGRHTATVYRSVEFLVADIVGHLRPALTEEGSALLIARPAHIDAVLSALTQAGVDTDAAQDSGDLIVADAASTLSRLTDVKGAIGASAHNKLAELLDGLAFDGRHVRAYGEMVSLLWEQGNIQGAMQLESLWNDLLRQRDLWLHCGYAAAVDHGADSGPEGTPASHELIRACHHAVRVE